MLNWARFIGTFSRTHWVIVLQLLPPKYNNFDFVNTTNEVNKTTDKMDSSSRSDPPPTFPGIEYLLRLVRSVLRPCDRSSPCGLSRTRRETWTPSWSECTPPGSFPNATCPQPRICSPTRSNIRAKVFLRAAKRKARRPLEFHFANLTTSKRHLIKVKRRKTDIDVDATATLRYVKTKWRLC